MQKRYRFMIAGIGAALYSASLALPTARTFGSNTEFGFDAFLICWEAMMEWKPDNFEWWSVVLAWLANPAIWIAVVAAAWGRWHISTLTASYALALCLLVLALFGDIVAGYPGFWVWAGSAAFLAASGIGMIWRRGGNLEHSMNLRS
jgi:hypothetical protein